MATRYNPIPNDLGMFLPATFTALPISRPAVPAGRVPVSLNPAAMLYSEQSLLPYSDPACASGCYFLNADPRSKQVKPLYTHNMYEYNGSAPTAYNVRGMY